MNNVEFLKCIGEIDDSYIESASQALGLCRVTAAKKQARIIAFKRYVLLAAVIILCLALVGFAVHFGMRHLKVGEHTNAANFGEASEPVDLISLQGFVGSSSYKAASEWQHRIISGGILWRDNHGSKKNSFGCIDCMPQKRGMVQWYPQRLYCTGQIGSP